jgi:hypothetical protein
MDKPERELIDHQLDGVCGGSRIYSLILSAAEQAKYANDELNSIINDQRDRMAHRDTQRLGVHV